MNRGHYDPPIAPVMTPDAADTRARWKWLVVPLGHAALIFLWLFASRWWFQPAESGTLSFSIDPEALMGMAKEASYQCGLVLVVTCLLLGALPRIHWRHALYASLALVIATCVVFLGAAYARRPITTNGEHLMTIVLTSAAVLLMSGVLIRRS
ncbi:MAG TPA: hypothetical protein VJS12_19895 [Steroidobacteraceae bacterium]|nr:hypothetical protein [Steroidobacteraceae bacterium]